MIVGKVKNHMSEQHVSEVYKHGTISAWKDVWEEYDENKDKWNKKSRIVCHLKRKSILNLGECNDGSPFTSVNQAVNVAKGLCNYDEEKILNRELRERGYKNEDLFKYNSLKDLERIKIKKDILNMENFKEVKEILFDNKLPERRICKDNSLYVVQNNEYHYYKIGGNFTTGFQGFKQFMEIIPMRGLIYPIYFNGQELSEKQTEQFWEQFDKFCKIK